MLPTEWGNEGERGRPRPVGTRGGCRVGWGPGACPGDNAIRRGVLMPRRMTYTRPGHAPGPLIHPPFTSRLFETRRSPEAVILSVAKDLRPARREILRYAQDDTSHLALAGSFPQKPTGESIHPP